MPGSVLSEFCGAEAWRGQLGRLGQLGIRLLQAGPLACRLPFTVPDMLSGLPRIGFVGRHDLLDGQTGMSANRCYPSFVPEHDRTGYWPACQGRRHPDPTRFLARDCRQCCKAALGALGQDCQRIFSGSFVASLQPHSDFPNAASADPSPANRSYNQKRTTYRDIQHDV